MLRRIRPVVLYLLLGVVATFAVSWWRAMSVRFGVGGSSAMATHIQSGLALHVAREDRLGARRLSVHLSRAPDDAFWVKGDTDTLLNGWSRLAAPSESLGEAGHLVEGAVVSMYGWPLHALHDERRFLGRAEAHESLAPIPALPTRPLWAGFVGDAMIFALVFHLATITGRLTWSRVVRGRLRLRRGLCPRCAYPIGASAVCTECGEAISRPPSLQ